MRPASPSRRTDPWPTRKEIDEVSGVETTGHEWDGIKELNNPLPRWWLWTFYACIIWALAYTVFYPAWPGITGATAGILGWSSRGELAKEMTELPRRAGRLSRQACGDRRHRSQRGSRTAAVRHRRRRIDLQGLLRAVPRFRRAGRSGLSEPQ
jgi:hypothetical protein